MVRAGETPVSALREREWPPGRAATVVRREETVIALFARAEADIVYGRNVWRVRLSGYFGLTRVQTEERRRFRRLPCGGALIRPARTRGNGRRFLYPTIADQAFRQRRKVQVQDRPTIHLSADVARRQMERSARAISTLGLFQTLHEALEQDRELRIQGGLRCQRNPRRRRTLTGTSHRTMDRPRRIVRCQDCGAERLHVRRGRRAGPRRHDALRRDLAGRRMPRVALRLRVRRLLLLFSFGLRPGMVEIQPRLHAPLAVN